MKKFLVRNFGVLVFYGVIILGVLLLNFRFSYLNNNTNNTSAYNQIALNK